MSSFLSAALSQSFVTGPCTKVQRKNNTHKGPPISQRTRPPFYASYPAPPLVKGLQGLVHGTVNKAGLVGILHLPISIPCKGFPGPNLPVLHPASLAQIHLEDERRSNLLQRRGRLQSYGICEDIRRHR